MFSIAWNAPWTIGWQLRFVKQHLANAVFLVADNSTDPEARKAIAAECVDSGVAYLALAGKSLPDRPPRQPLTWSCAELGLSQCGSSGRTGRLGLFRP